MTRATRAGASPALELRALEKSFRGGLGARATAVLHGVDLVLAPGERLGLVGPNGSGKSTLLSIAAGIEPPTRGEVRLFGLPPSSLAARRRLGYLPEGSPFPPELSARAALELLGSLHGLARGERRRRAGELLERVGLADVAGRALGRCSKGMLRRFGLAQAVLHRPDLLLLDEPTSGLDAEGFLVLDELLAEAAARGTALVICSHAVGDLVAHGERLAVLLEGRIVADGPPADLLGAHARRRLELEGLGADGLARVEALVAEAGGAVVAHGPGSDALLELYRRLGPGKRGAP